MNVLHYIENHIDYLSSHPKVAFIVLGANVVLAESIRHLEIPLFFMQCLQAGAWIVTIVVGLLTIRAKFKKRE